MKKLGWLLGFINASIGKRPVVSISAQELLVMLRKMEGKERYLQSNRGEWIEDTVEVPDGITIICAECYRQREADARLAGRRTIRHG